MDEIEQLERAAQSVRHADVSFGTSHALKAGLLRLQAAIDHLQVIQAMWLHAAEEASVFGPAGDRDAATWLAANGKTSKTAARRQAELGRAMNDTPALADAVASGTISPEAATALLPTLSIDHSGDIADLIDACAGATPLEARAAGARFRELHPPAGQTPSEREHALRQRRALRFSDNGDGTTDVRGTLVNKDAAVVEQSLRSLITKPTPGDDRTHEQKLADALVQLCTAHGNGEIRGGRANAPTILLTADTGDYINGTGFGVTTRGQPIPMHTVRQMTSHAFVQRVLLADSVPLDLGRAERLASHDQWKMLVTRDGGCRFAGCDMPPEWCQVDHIQDWTPHQGPTDIDLLVLWCVYHHGFRHRPDVQLHGDANDLSMRLPDGRVVPLPARGPTTKRRVA